MALCFQYFSGLPTTRQHVMVMQKHPIQPLCTDGNGTMRFKGNAIVRYLLDNGPFDLNHLAIIDATQQDREQFAQLIGYSLSGFGELSYVSSDTYDAAERMAAGQDERDARIADLERKLSAVREAMQALVPQLFQIHPDDLRA